MEDRFWMQPLMQIKYKEAKMKLIEENSTILFKEVDKDYSK